MKNKIILGSIFAVTLLIILPSIPAVEYNEVITENTRYYNLQCSELNYLKENIEKIDLGKIDEKNIKLIFVELKNSLEEINIGKYYESLKGQISKDGPQPQCIIIILIILKLVFRFIRSIVNIIVSFISNIVNFIRNLINLTELILYLIEQLSQLMDLIQQLIDFINSLLNPEILLS